MHDCSAAWISASSMAMFFSHVRECAYRCLANENGAAEETRNGRTNKRASDSRSCAKQLHRPPRRQTVLFNVNSSFEQSSALISNQSWLVLVPFSFSSWLTLRLNAFALPLQPLIQSAPCQALVFFPPPPSLTMSAFRIKCTRCPAREVSPDPFLDCSEPDTLFFRTNDRNAHLLFHTLAHKAAALVHLPSIARFQESSRRPLLSISSRHDL